MPTIRQVAPPRNRPEVTSTPWDSDTAYQHKQKLAEERNQALTELANCDLTTVDGWELARSLIKPHGGPLLFGDIADQAKAALPTHLAAVLTAFMEHPGFSLWENQTIIKGFTHLLHQTRGGSTFTLPHLLTTERVNNVQLRPRTLNVIVINGQLIRQRRHPRTRTAGQR